MKWFILLDETMCLACFLLNQLHGFMLFHCGIAFDLNPYTVFGSLLRWKNDFIILCVEKLMLYHITT